MNFVDVIKGCESANGAGSKKVIQSVLAKADVNARRLISEALNPYRVFNVKKFDMPSSSTKTMDEQQDFQQFFDLLDKLHDRELTGNAARDAVTASLCKFNIHTQQYLARILDKDLKAGFSAETFNKVWSKEPIPVFDVMLADKCESVEDFEKNINFPCQGDYKYDGIRFIVFVSEKSIEFRNRSGKIESTVDGLFDEDLNKIRKHLGYDYVLDGERISDLGFTDTMNAKKEGNDLSKANLRIRAFFLMPMIDWKNQKTELTMRTNRENLKKLFEEVECSKILLTEGREVKNYKDMMNFCNDAIDLPENAARKIEGLILKDWDAHYEWDRKMTWCKVKRFYDVDCKITGFYAGKKGSRLENTLGGIYVEGYDEHNTKVVARVGSGFSDAQRNEIWNNQDKFLNTTAVITYQEITKAKNKEDCSLRFPTYSHARDDKVVF